MCICTPFCISPDEALTAGSRPDGLQAACFGAAAGLFAQVLTTPVRGAMVCIKAVWFAFLSVALVRREE